eukprot:Opistho-2@63812
MAPEHASQSAHGRSLVLLAVVCVDAHLYPLLLLGRHPLERLARSLRLAVRAQPCNVAQAKLLHADAAEGAADVHLDLDRGLAQILVRNTLDVHPERRLHLRHEQLNPLLAQIFDRKERRRRLDEKLCVAVKVRRRRDLDVVEDLLCALLCESLVKHSASRQRCRKRCGINVKELGCSGQLVLVRSLALCVVNGSEVDISEVEDSGDHLQGKVDVVLREANDAHGLRHLVVERLVVDVLDSDAVALIEIIVLLGITLQAHRRKFVRRRARKEEIEDVEVALALPLARHARLLEQIVGDLAANGIRLEIKLHVHVLSKAGRIVVAVGLGVAKCLQNGIGLEQLIFDLASSLVVAAHSSNKLHDELGRLCLSSATFSSDDDALVLCLCLDIAVCFVRQCENVRGHLVHLLPIVLANLLGAKDGKVFERIG